MVQPSSAAWRTDMLFEFWCDNPRGTFSAPRGGYCHHVICSDNNTYAGVLTETGLKYVEFLQSPYLTSPPIGALSEFYDLNKDPNEMRNAVHDAAAQADVARLQKRLAGLRECQSGAQCRAPPAPA